MADETIVFVVFLIPSMTLEMESRATEFWRTTPHEELVKAENGLTEGVALKRLGTVEQVASSFVHLITNGFITGQVLAVDRGVMLRR